jgi:peptidoglycan-associated lipoprotein
MRNTRWMFVPVVLGLALVLSVTGCKKKPKGGPGGLAGSDVGVAPIDVYSEGLSDRFAGGVEVPGQFTPVYFDYDSSVIKDSERSKIEAVAYHLKKNAGTKLIVEGHCDERGSNEYNLALGERRALAIRAYLVGLGIEGDRIQTKSYGEERPVAPGHDESAWRLNRRGEFVLVQ